MKRFGKVVKKFRETGQTSNRPGQCSKWLKTQGKSWGQIPVIRWPNWPQRLESARLQCAASLRRTSTPSPTRCRSAMSSHPHMRLKRCRHLLNLMEDGMLPNLVFYEKKFDVEQCANHQNDRVWGRNARQESWWQNSTSVMFWAAVTATGTSLPFFVPSGVKLNSSQYISDILQGQLLPWAREHFEGAPWIFQQDSAPSHGSRMTQW